MLLCGRAACEARVQIAVRLRIVPTIAGVFAGVWRPFLAAAQIISRAQFFAAPADAVWMFWMERIACHAESKRADQPRIALYFRIRSIECWFNTGREHVKAGLRPGKFASCQ